MIAMTAEARSLALVVAVLSSAMALPSTDGGVIAQYAAPSMHGLTCGVSQIHGVGVIEYRGTASAPYSVAGEYRFEVARSGPGGQSVTRQAGMFELVPNAPRILATIVLDANEADMVDASLVLTIQGQDVSCQSIA